MRLTKEERDKKLIELGNKVEVNRNYNEEDSENTLKWLGGNKK